MYPHDSEFVEIFNACTKFNTNGYFRNNGYLFKEKRLCVPKCSIRDLLVMGHFGLNPWNLLDFLPMPNISILKHRDSQAKVDYVRKLHENVKAQIEKKSWRLF